MASFVTTFGSLNSQLGTAIAPVLSQVDSVTGSLGLPSVGDVASELGLGGSL